ncbi:hypothetical protein [Chryseobacterium sp. ERMR1:04]|uniref:CIS tube protein n=1 Tax=Chryseobacterium sp. ERMR1:04 TaxID=1705393 RepID=UPI0006C89CF3|nr:hypothetical protein [Chryseobacterium sp. ERMR1:04]KPH15032.1 hypothetical protein AMQ68_06400 [Chryseobacterium sp. ERMR1:04]
MRGALTKLKIDTYKDDSYSPDAKINTKAFEAFINPTGFSVTYKTKHNTNQAQGKSKASLGYIVSLASGLQLEFLFDGTGVTESNPGNKLINKIKGKVFAKQAVKQQIKDFYKATGELAGPIHKPYHVVLHWGDFEFKGILSELTIEYKLFDNEGLPLRAIGKATFNESISPELESKMANTNSPDLTHKRTVQDGDTLPLMTERIYGDSKYYLEVAKVNGLINFRQLKPGQDLFFPPLEKVS